MLGKQLAAGGVLVAETVAIPRIPKCSLVIPALDTGGAVVEMFRMMEADASVCPLLFLEKCRPGNQTCFILRLKCE